MDNQEWTIKNEQSRMNNQEWTIKNEQSRDIGNTENTRHKDDDKQNAKTHRWTNFNCLYCL
jgi:hypothetical protein